MGLRRTLNRDASHFHVLEYPVIRFYEEIDDIGTASMETTGLAVQHGFQLTAAGLPVRPAAETWLSDRLADIETLTTLPDWVTCKVDARF
jgi:hypothetical protein